MSFMLRAEAGRTKDYTVTIKSPSGGYVALESTDVVRVKIGRVGAIALDLDGTATAQGSVVTVTELGDGSSVHAAASIRLAQGDTEGMSGIYAAEVLVVDDSDGDLVKAVDYGCIGFEPSQDGDVGLA